MKVLDIMSSPVISINLDTTVEEAAKLMCEKNISALPVLDSDHALVGILTESDFVGKEYKPAHALASLRNLFGEISHLGDVEEAFRKAKTKKLQDVMTKNPKTIGVDDSLSFVVSFMHSNNLKRLPVVDKNKVVGIVTRKDLIKAFNNL